jgi:filamentous hemagglutinin
LLGTDPYAVANPSGGQYGSPNDLLPSAPFGFQPPTTAAEVSTRMLEAGNGSVGVVRIQQGGPIEHVINVVNKNDKVYFIDSQSGHIVNIKPDVPVLLGTP